MNIAKTIPLLLALSAAVAIVVALKKNDGQAPAENLPTPSTRTVPPTPAVEPGTSVEPLAPRKLPRLVDLGATKCIPCKLMAPILEELKTTYAGKMEIQFIDVWENPTAGREYGIRIIPTQIFYDASGKELFRHEGYFGRDDILGVWQKHGITFE
jgi:thioredoxin 1